MEFAGIITEYDPFHNGHAAQLAAVRRAGARRIAVCLSSGAVQRGGAPILPESVRVRAALAAGADLVVALPAPYACATAEQFAAAGVALLAALGCDTLAFGAETPHAAQLLHAAGVLQSEALQPLVRQNLAAGMTYAAARAAAAETLEPGLGALLRTPNNILGIEYCKAIRAQNAPLTPLALPRWGAAHGGAPGWHAGTAMASASYLRAQPVEAWAPYVPPAAQALYAKARADGLLLSPARLETALLALLRARPAADFAAVRGVSEGLEHRLAAAVRDATGLEDLYTPLKNQALPPTPGCAAWCGTRRWAPPPDPARPAVFAGAGRAERSAALPETGRAAGRHLTGRFDAHRRRGAARRRAAQPGRGPERTVPQKNLADGACVYRQTGGSIIYGEKARKRELCCIFHEQNRYAATKRKGS